MATFTSTQAATTYPIYKPVGSNIKCVSWGTIAVTANPVAADIYQMCWLPAGARVLGGMIRLADLDTNATETFDIDLGWANNGGTGTYDAADSDGLGNLGVLTGDAFATGNLVSVVGGVYALAGPFLTVGLFPTFTKNTLIQFTCVATCATFTAGQLSCEVDYVVA
jgi:hypothetical protein